jgi:hypothetical protein
VVASHAFLAAALEQMVPLSREIGISFARQLTDIVSAWQASWSPTDPDTCFSRWATLAAGLKMPFAGADNGVWAALPEGRWDEAPILAAGGFRMAEGNVDLVEPWSQGMKRLAQREPFPADRQSFFFRPVELLGVATGAAAVRDLTPEFATWIAELLSRGEERIAEDTLSRALAALARRAVCGDAGWIAVDAGTSLLEAAFFVWAATAFPEVSWCRVPRHDLELDLVRQAAVSTVDVRNAASAGIAWLGLRLAVSRVVDATIASAAAGDVVERVVSICRRFPLLTRELRRRHGDRPPLLVTDEYEPGHPATPACTLAWTSYLARSAWSSRQR